MVLSNDHDLPVIDYLDITYEDDILEEEMIESDEKVDSELNEVDFSLVRRLLEIFPEACPKYIRSLCSGNKGSLPTIDNLISQILDTDYPKRKATPSCEPDITADEQLEILRQVLPNADPNFLKINCDRFINKPDELKAFVTQLIETGNYPTMKEYLRNQQISAQQRQYTTEFSVEKFLEVIPDPISYFDEQKFKYTKLSPDGIHYAITFLRNHFPRIPIRIIRETYKTYLSNLLKICNILQKMDPKSFIKSKRYVITMPKPPQDIPLLQEIAFIEHREDILKSIENRQAVKQKERELAEVNGLLQTCSCCYDEEVMPEEIFCCENSCKFCKSCVAKSVEVAFGDGKLDFYCLLNCGSQFTLQVLQAVLPPKMFSIIALKKQVQEVKSAGIEDLETCPFCDFATIPPKDDKLFRCLNPECMKESCRQCKEPSHLPLRCEEVEKEDEVKVRTYIEDKMTEALLRKCYKCGMKFIKTDGCKKMTCTCGARMCYICKKPVKDYKHFNGPGGDKTHLCPLFSDTNQLHQEAVLQGAQVAKEEVGVYNATMKIDPTADVKEHYKLIVANNHTVPNAYNQAAANLERMNHFNVFRRGIVHRRNHGYHRHRHNQNPHPHHQVHNDYHHHQYQF